MASNILNQFFDLIKISIGNKDGFHQLPTDKAFQQLYDIACKQSLAGVLLEGINKAEIKQKDILAKQRYRLRLCEADMKQLVGLP